MNIYCIVGFLVSFAIGMGAGWYLTENGYIDFVLDCLPRKT